MKKSMAFPEEDIILDEASFDKARITDFWTGGKKMGSVRRYTISRASFASIDQRPAARAQRQDDFVLHFSQMWFARLVMPCFGEDHRREHSMIQNSFREDKRKEFAVRTKEDGVTRY